VEAALTDLSIVALSAVGIYGGILIFQGLVGLVDWALERWLG
jgi:hypothetical protein